MKIQLVSDIHAEFGSKVIDAAIKKTDADVLIVAGDLNIFPRNKYSLEKIQKIVEIPVIYVLGNHEFYGVFKNGYKYRRDHFKFIKEIDDVVFICAIGWTDGSYMKWEPYMKYINDVELIDGFRQAMGGQEWGRCDYRFISMALKENKNKKMVVVTHHLPSSQSISQEYLNAPSNVFFANKWEHLMLEFQPALWIHGHTHSSCDYMIDKTRVLCNPYGYWGRQENKDFNPELVIEI